MPRYAHLILELLAFSSILSKIVACYLMKGKLCPSLTEFQVTKQLTKTAPISGGSGKQHRSSAAVDSFGYMMRCVNVKFRLLFSVMKLRPPLSGIKRMKMSSVLCTLSSVRNGCSVSKYSNSAQMFSTQTLLGFLLNNPVKNEIFY